MLLWLKGFTKQVHYVCISECDDECGGCTEVRLVQPGKLQQVDGANLSTWATVIIKVVAMDLTVLSMTNSMGWVMLRSTWEPAARWRMKST